MKLFALQQSYATRRSSSFRSSSSPLDLASEGTGKSPSSVFWLALHGLCCLISLVLGFRFSRLVFFLLFSSSASTSFYPTTPFLDTETLGMFTPVAKIGTGVGSVVNKSGVSSRVVVGRHGIRIRPWPHPDPVETMKAGKIIERVQKEQRLQYGVKNGRSVIVVTPTYVRTFQTPHLIGVMHSLMNLKYDVVWIVVEAGGKSNETAGIIAKSGLRTIHVGFEDQMASTWEGRHLMEARMRVRALRVVRDEKLDGIVVFADDSNMHSLELFDEIQNVKWFGAISVGILVHSSNGEDPMVAQDEESLPLPVQGPACNSSRNLVGWHTFNSLPFKGKRAINIDDRGVVLPRQLEWAGFVLNSRMVWNEEVEGKPDWVKDLDSIDEDIGSPLSLLKDASMVEPLGECGRKVLLWWLRVEARTDSKFPPGWIINPPLEVTVPAKQTPWADTPPELPKTEKVAVTTEHTSKQSTKTRTPRTKRSSRHKRKHDTQQGNTQDIRRRSIDK